MLYKEITLPVIPSGATSFSVDIGITADKVYILMSELTEIYIAKSPINKLGFYGSSGVSYASGIYYQSNTSLFFQRDGDNTLDFFSQFSGKKLNVFYTN
ncbi:hypothetical protein [Aminicella lysinilytica]|uniref:hypothetical protein n=1 Tax=Aminicella lysinilytica TaxID=433323 RepID=UPI00105D9421|nr:hypothetical protein [Aminicella lysinilytica]